MRQSVNIPEGVRLVGTFVSTFLTALIVIVALFLVIIRVTGCALLSIESSSMSPAFPVNSVVLAVPVDFDDLAVGDVVTYVLDESGTLVTHRVVAIDEQARTLTTKGDANASADATAVSADNVVGKVVLCVPGLGGALKAVSDGAARVPVIVCTAIVLVLALAGEVVARVRARRRHKARKGGAHERPAARHARAASERVAD